ncbi:MAG: hypothetical protein ACLVFN_12685 [Enterocloster sp.]
MIDHGGASAQYTCIAPSFLQARQKVKKGQTIARVGFYRIFYRSHLQFGVSPGGSYKSK